MSHVVKIEARINDLDCLAKAAKDCGMELRRDQKTFKWFGTHVGDYPLPQGFTKEDMGVCVHALSVKDNPNAYEVGVSPARDGKGGYVLLLDFWAGGNGLVKHIGNKTADKLLQRYQVQVNKKVAIRQGYAVQEHERTDGTVELQLTKRAGY